MSKTTELISRIDTAVNDYNSKVGNYPNVTLSGETISVIKKDLNAIEMIKSKAIYDEKNMKYIIEVEVDDFNSSTEWDNFKEVLNEK